MRRILVLTVVLALLVLLSFSEDSVKAQPQRYFWNGWQRDSSTGIDTNPSHFEFGVWGRIPCRFATQWGLCGYFWLVAGTPGSPRGEDERVTFSYPVDLDLTTVTDQGYPRITFSYVAWGHFEVSVGVRYAGEEVTWVMWGEWRAPEPRAVYRSIELKRKRVVGVYVQINDRPSSLGDQEEARIGALFDYIYISLDPDVAAWRDRFGA